MNDFFGQLYKDIINRIKAEAADVRFIEMDLGQMDYDLRPALAYPACLIDFPMTTYSNLGGNQQLGEVTITLKLCFAIFSTSSGNAPEQVKDKALQCYQTEQQVVEALQGWHPDYCTHFNRASVTTLDRYNEIGMRVRMLTFTTSYEDDSMHPRYTKQKVRIKLV